MDEIAYELMASCWKEMTEERLTFEEMEIKIHDALENVTFSYGYIM